jgi:two-component system, chemotaxis family, protein-glutamate methylesterase/glutaminase
LKVLVVDDSVVFRMAISTGLTNVSGVDVVGTASNGQLALDFIEKNKEVDIMILDMEMPVLNGIETIKAVRKINRKIIIIVFSSLTLNGAELTLEALDLGANDFVTKQEASSAVNLEESLKMIEKTLVPKMRAFQSVLAKGRHQEFYTPATEINNPGAGVSESLIVDVKNCLNQIQEMPQLVLIASSTGGPDALAKIFEGITKKAKVPIMLVQHMPPIFTNKLAELLNKKCSQITVKEAEEGELLKPGVCYIAPGDYHMTLSRALKVVLNQDPKVSYVRPSATVLFDSVIKNYMAKTLTIVLTGMGDDGASGVEKLVNRGDYAYIQDESTSVVWGMPSATRSKCPNIKEMPIEEIPVFLNMVFEKSA